MKRLLATPALLVFLGVVVVLALANREFFFVQSWHEHGDFAVNALQIERAKHLDELYGNYSRFGFNHPGPAFFYVYAVGEIIFHDWLHLVPSPHSAHALAGLILQAFFFTAALSVASGWIRTRLFLPLALLFGALHFGLAENTFTSIWPPHALVMPFLCFLVAGASLSAGRVAHLPLAALTGCFLVHGYVAQPLFVIPLISLAYGLCWFRAREPQERLGAFVRRHRWPHIVAASCIALFVLPLLIDLTYGGESNFSRIVESLHGHRNEHQTLWHALVYLLSFFCYLHNQDTFLPDRVSTDTHFLGQNLPYFLGWACILLIIAVYVIKLPRNKDQAGANQTSRPFVIGLIMILAMTLALSLVWGKIQVGPMFEFNGKFYYGTLYGIVLLLAAAISQWLPSRSATALGLVCCVGAATIAWRFTRLPVSAVDCANNPILAGTRAALRADPLPQAPKLLVFNHDDWGDAASAALALKRMGLSYRVDGNWSFMFGQYRTVRPVPPDFDLSGMSIWRFVRGARAEHGVSIAKDLWIVFEPTQLDPANTVIDCAKGGNLDRFSLFGFTTPDSDSSWTNMPDAGIQFRTTRASHDVHCSIVATPFAPLDRNISSQPMDLYVNGQKIGSYTISDKTVVAARIPAETWNLRPVVTIVLHIPNAISPAKLGMSGDPRMLGWAIQRMSFSYAP